MSRPKHPNKDIEKALRYAESNGWTVEKSGKSAHAWGSMKCPSNNQCRGGLFCVKSIWSTPRNTANHAKDIRNTVNKCEF